MRMYDIIKKKRDGGKLSKAEINYFVKGCTDGSIPDYQISALCMAIYFQGMDLEETTACDDGAPTATLTAGFGFGTIRRAGAVAIRAILWDGDFKGAFGAEQSLLQVDIEVEAEVGSALGGVRVCLTAAGAKASEASKASAEDRSQDVA